MASARFRRPRAARTSRPISTRSRSGSTTTTARRSPACRRTSVSSRPDSRRRGIESDTQANGPLRGHCRVDLGHLVAATLLDHDAVVIPVTPAFMPAAVPTDLGACAVPIAMVAATLDDDGLGAGNGRRRNRDRTERRDDITKLLHGVLLTDKCGLNLQ